MNIIIKDTTDFFNAINCDTDDEDRALDQKTCLISGSPLTYNFITLPCNHTFNYDILFDEITHQKKNNSCDRYMLKFNELKCPYCRKIHNKLLPYLPFDRFKKRYHGVNHPQNNTTSLNTCNYIYKSGKKQNIMCGAISYENKNGHYCNRHHSIVEKSNIKNANKADNIKKPTIKNSNKADSIIISPYDAQYNILNKITIKGLKEILRENKLPLGGNKKELISRIIKKPIT